MDTVNVIEEPQQLVVISAQVSAETRAELERRAAAADRTLSAQVRRALAEHLRSDDEEEEGT